MSGYASLTRPTPTQNDSAARRPPANTGHTKPPVLLEIAVHFEHIFVALKANTVIPSQYHRGPASDDIV
jgi:hypothetical protein